MGDAPEWIARRFLQEAVKAGSAALSRTRNEDVHSGLPDLPNAVIDIIGELSGWPIKLDPKKRIGDSEFQNSHAEWTRLSRGGRYKMTAEDYARNNEATGSSFYAPIFNFPCRKQNYGFLHTSSGHINHY